MRRRGAEQERIDLRVSSEVKEVIQRAADLLGTTTSAFVANHASGLYVYAKDKRITHVAVVDPMTWSRRDFRPVAGNKLIR